MKLYFKQRFFSWFDSYDIWHEDGSVAYTVQGRLAWAAPTCDVELGHVNCFGRWNLEGSASMPAGAQPLLGITCSCPSRASVCWGIMTLGSASLAGDSTHGAV